MYTFSGAIAAAPFASTPIAGDDELPLDLALAATEAPDIASAAVSSNTNLALGATEAQDVCAISVEAVFNERDVALAATEAQDVCAIAASILSTVTLQATEAKDTFAAAVEAGTSLSLGATEAPDVAAISVVIPSDIVLNILCESGMTVGAGFLWQTQTVSPQQWIRAEV
jgi:hypothetical protein